MATPAAVTREMWLDIGVFRFGEAGLAGLNVQAMARELGSSKAGFYWYFKSRARFERALFAHWRLHETDQVITEAERARSPVDKLRVLFDAAMRLRRSGDFLFYLRRLARSRKDLARLLADTEGERLAYLASVLVDLGKGDAEAREIAERIYHFYLGWYERSRFRKPGPEEVARQLRGVSAMIGVDLNEPV